MRIKYSKESDILLISLREGKPADSIDLKEGVILHLSGGHLDSPTCGHLKIPHLKYQL